jgi:hypothetical protein
MSLGEFRERMGTLYERVTGGGRAEGVERIYFPGEIEVLKEEERLKTGIPLVQAEIDALNKEAEMSGAPLLPTSRLRGDGPMSTVGWNKEGRRGEQPSGSSI